MCSNLLILGYPQQALEKAAAAAREAQVLGQPIWIAVTAAGQGMVHQLRGEPQCALELTELAMSIANEHGMSPIARIASSFRALSLVNLGRVEEGAAQMQMLAQAEDGAAQSVAATIGLAYACGAGNRPEKGLRLLLQALELIERTGERKDEALLWWVWGELLVKRGDRYAAEGERRFRTAVEVAARQSAKSYELHATLGLARLLARQNRRDEARAMLADIYGWFTEGFDTLYLKDAKALLNELTQPA